MPDASDELMYRCPITQEVMENPVTLIGDGQTYEEEALKTWLADNNRSPLTGASLESKDYCVNFALKNLISEWRKTKASDKLKNAQKARFEALFKTTGQDLESLDIEITVGEDKRVFRCVRAMVGAMSPFFGAMLLSDEGRASESFELLDLSGDGFEQILRVAYCLDPVITTDNVMQTLTAAHTCEVIRLKNECLAYLASNLRDEAMVDKVRVALEPDNDFGIDEELRDILIGLLLNRPLNGENVMSVFNSALSLKMLTPLLEKKCCRAFTTQGEVVVNSESFMTTRAELLHELVKSDYFFVNEQLLWKRVLAWCQKQLELETEAIAVGDGGEEKKEEESGAEDTSATEEKKEAAEEEVTFHMLDEKEIGGALGIELLNEEEQRKLKRAAKNVGFPAAAMKYLTPMLEDFRFGLMDMTFFAENVSPLLPRVMSETVLVNKVKAAMDQSFIPRPRVDPQGSSGPTYMVLSAFRNVTQAQVIPDPNREAEWSRVKWGEGGGPQWFTIDCYGPVTASQFDMKNHYDDNDTISEMELYALPLDVEYSNELGPSDEHWRLVGKYEIAKSKQWQSFVIIQPPELSARYYKWVITAIHGESGNYTCLNHLKMTVHREQWTTNFANKLV